MRTTKTTYPGRYPRRNFTPEAVIRLKIATTLVYCYTLYLLSVFSMAKILQSILEISKTYGLVSSRYLVAVNLLICRLRAQCMTSKSTFKLCSARLCFFAVIFFKLQKCVKKQLLDSSSADNN